MPDFAVTSEKRNPCGALAGDFCEGAAPEAARITDSNNPLQPNAVPVAPLLDPAGRHAAGFGLAFLDFQKTLTLQFRLFRLSLPPKYAGQLIVRAGSSGFREIAFRSDTAARSRLPSRSEALPRS